jgi:hypothetical protein
MRLFFALTLLVACGTFSIAQETPLVSPRRSFTISQQQNGGWTTTLCFAHAAHPDVTLAGGYPWPALFFISPDDRWILQIQKSGSGDNISFLYRVEQSGRVWRMQQDFGDLAFHFLEQLPGVDRAEMYHTGIEFRAWSMRDDSLRFSIRGSSVEQSGKGVEQELIYDLKNHQFRTPKA